MVSSNSDELANLTIAQLCLGRGEFIFMSVGFSHNAIRECFDSFCEFVMVPRVDSWRYFFVRVFKFYFTGGRVSDMTNVVENTPTGVTFIRPLRDISSEEIAVALRLEDSERYILLPHLMVSRIME